jgi:hypothetical protein
MGKWKILPDSLGKEKPKRCQAKTWPKITAAGGNLT